MIHVLLIRLYGITGGFGSTTDLISNKELKTFVFGKELTDIDLAWQFRVQRTGLLSLFLTLIALYLLDHKFNFFVIFLFGWLLINRLLSFTFVREFIITEDNIWILVHLKSFLIF